jgi:hypothetical protein
MFEETKEQREARLLRESRGVNPYQKAIDDKRPEPLDVNIAVQLAAGLLAGPNVSHQDTEGVAKLAVKHARNLIAEIRKEAEIERNRAAMEENRIALEKKASDEHFAREKKLADDKVTLEKRRLDEAKKIRDEELKAQEQAHKAEFGPQLKTNQQSLDEQKQGVPEGALGKENAVLQPSHEHINRVV